MDLGRNLGYGWSPRVWKIMPPGSSWTRLAATPSRTNASAASDDLIDWLEQQAATPHLQRQQ
jgi:hypothetical protein